MWFGPEPDAALLVCPCQGSAVAVVINFLSRVQLFVTPWTAAHQASLSFTISRSLLKLSYRVGDAIHHLILCRPFSPCPQSLPASGSFPVAAVVTALVTCPGASGCGISLIWLKVARSRVPPSWVYLVLTVLVFLFGASS